MVELAFEAVFALVAALLEELRKMVKLVFDAVLVEESRMTEELAFDAVCALIAALLEPRKMEKLVFDAVLVEESRMTEELAFDQDSNFEYAAPLFDTANTVICLRANCPAPPPAPLFPDHAQCAPSVLYPLRCQPVSGVSRDIEGLPPKRARRQRKG